MEDCVQYKMPLNIGLGDNQTARAVGHGMMWLNMTLRTGVMKKRLSWVLYVPNMACILFLIWVIDELGYLATFGRGRCFIWDKRRKVVVTATLEDKMYILDCEPVPCKVASVASVNLWEADLWHQRVGHINNQVLSKVVKGVVVKSIKVKDEEPNFCKACMMGKMARQPFKATGDIWSKRKLQLVHSDMCGLMDVESFSGKKYFITFTDNFTRCSAVYFMKSKAEALEKFKEFKAVMTNMSGKKIGTLRSDNGGEHVRWIPHVWRSRIQHETTVPHIPEQNGVAERMNSWRRRQGQC